MPRGRKGKRNQAPDKGDAGCPRCKLPFDSTIPSRNPVRENCGHVWCRACLKINLRESPDTCSLCEAEKNKCLRCGKVFDDTAPSLSNSVRESCGHVWCRSCFKKNLVENPDGCSACNIGKPGRPGNIQLDQGKEVENKRSQIQTRSTILVGSSGENGKISSELTCPSGLSGGGEKSAEAKRLPVVEGASKKRTVHIDDLKHRDDNKEVHTTDVPDKFLHGSNEIKTVLVPLKKKWKSAYAAEMGHTSGEKWLNLESPDSNSGKPLNTGAKTSAAKKLSSSEIVTRGAPPEVSMSNSATSTKKVPVGTKETKQNRKARERRPFKHVPNVIEISDLNKGFKYQCNACQRQFKKKSECRLHKICIEGPDARPFQCTMCERRFMSKALLEYHSRLHAGNKPFSCNICRRRFAQRSKLQSHKNLHYKMDFYTCGHCNKAFCSRTTLQAHFLLAHLETSVYQCPHCSKKFVFQSRMERHIAKVHDEPQEYMCDKCAVIVPDKYELSMHMKNHENPKQHACDECGRTFSLRKDLKRHQIIHQDIKPYACGLCGASFNRKDNYDRHLTNSHGVKLGSTPPKLQPNVGRDKELEKELRVTKPSSGKKLAVVSPSVSTSGRKTGMRPSSGISTEPNKSPHSTEPNKSPHILIAKSENVVRKPGYTEVVLPSPPLGPHRNQFLRGNSSLRNSFSDNESGGSGDSGIDLLESLPAYEKSCTRPTCIHPVPVRLDPVDIEYVSNFETAKDSVLKLTHVRTSEECVDKQGGMGIHNQGDDSKMFANRQICTFILNRPCGSSANQSRKN